MPVPFLTFRLFLWQNGVQNTKHRELSIKDEKIGRYLYKILRKNRLTKKERCCIISKRSTRESGRKQKLKKDVDK